MPNDLLTSADLQTVEALLSILVVEVSLIGGYFFFQMVYHMIIKFMDKK